MYWLFCFVRFFTQLRETLEVRDFCHNRYCHQIFCSMCFGTVIIVGLGRVMTDQIFSGFRSLSQHACSLVFLRTLIWYSLTRKFIFLAFYKLEYSCSTLYAMVWQPNSCSPPCKFLLVQTIWGAC
jgi:hypothetical protein